MATARWGALALLLTACPPPDLLRGRPAAPRAEEEDIVPVGGYEVLTGTWDTVRRGAHGERRLRLLFQIEGHQLKGMAPPDEAQNGPVSDHAVRIECEVQHRTCVGTWYENGAHGNLVLRFGTDFASFEGRVEGEAQVAGLAAANWTGTLAHH